MFRTSHALRVTLATALFVAAIGTSPGYTSESRADACLSTDRIDGSTAAQAVQSMEAAGFMQPKNLRKGCDNYWYAQATKGGATVDVVLPPGGEAFTTHNS